MRRFEKLGVIGNGAFGIVTKCRDRKTGDLVAIKMMKQKYSSFEECLQLKEVISLRKIKHENVVKLLQVFRENDYLYLVFELLPDGSLLRTINERKIAFSEPEIRYIIMQILQGLSFIHKQGFFHRDIKPDNLLWCGHTLKIADFGLAKEIRSRPPYTEYVATRWYRAPEIILKHESYNSPVDIWAVGVIMAELYLLKPLFQGNSETDQFYKISSILGPITTQNWPEGVKLASRLGFRLLNTLPIPLSSLLPNASENAIDLMSQMLRYDPLKRPSALQALQHPFFNGEKCFPLNEVKMKKEQQSPGSNDSKINIFSKYLLNENNNSNQLESIPPKINDPLFCDDELPLTQTSKSRRPVISTSFLKSMQSFEHIPTQNSNRKIDFSQTLGKKINMNASLKFIDSIIKPLPGQPLYNAKCGCIFQELGFDSSKSGRIETNTTDLL